MVSQAGNWGIFSPSSPLLGGPHRADREGLAPHKFTPMPGAHNFVKRTRGDTWCRFLQIYYPRAACDRPHKGAKMGIGRW